METSPFEAGGVQSIEVGISLLQPFVRAGTALPLKAISTATGIPRAKVHRYLVSFCRSKLLEQDPVSGHYRLGALALELGLSSLAQLDKDAIGHTAIREIRDEFSVSTCLCVWGTNGATVVAAEPAAHAVFLGIRTGSNLPLLSSASGRVFLAYLPESLTQPLVRKERGHGSPSKADLRGLQEEVRARQLGVAHDSVMRGMSGLAAPVFDHSGTVYCTLTVVGATGTFDIAPDGALAQALKAKAQDVSKRLGWRHR